MQNHFKPMGSLPLLPKVGVQMMLPVQYDQFTWLGRGPHESYIDRKRSADVGLYRGSVAEQYVPYVKTQENGNKTDVRWAALTDRSGNGLMVITDGAYYVSAHHNTALEYDQAQHINEIKPDKKVVFCVDVAQMGLGGASCGPGPMQKYRLSPGPMNMHYIICPVQSDNLDKMSQQGRQRLPIPVSPVVDSRVKSSTDNSGKTMKSRELILQTSAADDSLYYWFDTLNGRQSAQKYTKPFIFDRAGTIFVQAVSKEGIPGVPVSVDFDKFYDLKNINKRRWKVVKVDSFQPNEGEARNAIDNNPNTYWHTNWTSSREQYPHELQLDLGENLNLIGIKYLPRQDSANGRIANYELQLSLDGQNWSTVVKDHFANNTDWQQKLFNQPVIARYLKLIALKEVSNAHYASMAELDVMALND